MHEVFERGARTRLWIRLRDFMPAKAGCIHSASSVMSTSFSSLAYGFFFSAGTWISSHPCAALPPQQLSRALGFPSTL